MNAPLAANHISHRRPVASKCANEELGATMALVRCDECGGAVSDRAIACPRCGAPVPQERMRWKTVALLFACVAALLTVIGWGLIQSVRERQAGSSSLCDFAAKSPRPFSGCPAR